MTSETYLALVHAYYKRLMEHNNGWAIVGSHAEREIGKTYPYCGMDMKILAVATEAEARADADYLQLRFAPYEYYYRFSTEFPKEEGAQCQ